MLGGFEPLECNSSLFNFVSSKAPREGAFVLHVLHSFQHAENIILIDRSRA